jgi:hypothetical protein
LNSGRSVDALSRNKVLSPTLKFGTPAGEIVLQQALSKRQSTVGFYIINVERLYQSSSLCACSDWNKTVEGAIMLVVSNCYIIFGIALLSMCLNLMQEQIIDSVSRRTKWQSETHKWIKDKVLSFISR